MKTFIPILCLLLVSCSSGKGFEPVVLDLSRKTPTPAPPAAPTAGPVSPSLPGPSPAFPAGEGPARDSPAGAPETVVRSRTEAWERGDIEGTVALYAADARIYDPPDRLRDSGTDQIRQSLARELASSPRASATGAERMIEGRFVVERERRAGQEKSAIVIYEVLGGKIARVWILR